ncbi:cation:proton antiporter [Collinsella sp. zg1085]|uniref:cation:proton antiporter domain-containing protein n=1 Tax=Collinsella sp. zg1085 TaxID=2844380 RepID=UPI001C0AD6F8|nr:cation:proton antiporter [Collinsella sp. zg1085]QWT17532.1 cation:proton antiporter [Collinsella sp. zg1085]
MHGDTILLMTFVLALVAAFVGGLTARMLKLPPLVGYLLGGLAVGPFTPGFIGDSHAMNQLAEVGVMFMMFGTGLHFSLKDLNEVKGIAIPGAVLQITLGTLAGYALAQAFGWEPAAGVMLGLSVSIASTVVLIKNLTDEGLYHTQGGRVATGWLIVEDLVTVLILVVLPVVFGSGDISPQEIAQEIALALIKTVVFVALMLVVGSRVLPWLLVRIARFCPRELFQLAVVVIALGTAIAAATLFDLSVALGAFLAGVVVSGSKLSHRVAAETIPFQDLFSIIFFASVGMMVNPGTLFAHMPELLVLVALIILGKWLINMLLGLLFSAGVSTSLTIAAGLSQIGEFSFIIGQTGMALGILSADQYALILGSAVISIALNSFVFKLERPLETYMHHVPVLQRLFERRVSTFKEPPHDLQNHVVIVGYGTVGSVVADVLSELEVPVLVVERDLPTAELAEAAGIPVLVGDAANSEILRHAHVERARELVLTISRESSAVKIAYESLAMHAGLRIAARATTEDGLASLAEAGVVEAVRPELEGGIELLRHTLLDLDFKANQIQAFVDALRVRGYEAMEDSARSQRVQAFEQLMASFDEVNMRWVEVGRCEVAGLTLTEINLRARTGAQAIAMRHQGLVMPIHDASAPLEAGDTLGLMGTNEQIDAAVVLLSDSEDCDC